jgi:hypothetical protein
MLFDEHMVWTVDSQRNEMLVMPNYSLRTKFVLEPNDSDEPIGSFANRDIALVSLNKNIPRDGKETGSVGLAIASFAFRDSGLKQLCHKEYFLVEIRDGKEESHRLFPKNGFLYKPMKTTTFEQAFGPSGA